MAVAGRKDEEMKTDDVHLCGPCEEDSELIACHGFCSDCMDYLCIDCFKSHRKSRASKHHKLFTNAELLTEGVTQTKTSLCNESCDVHKRELIKFYCVGHKTLGCSDCIILQHRTCQLEYIPDQSPGYSSSKEFKDTERALNKELEEATKAMKKVNIVEDIIENMHEQCLRDIDSFQAELIDHIKKLRNQMKKQAEKKNKKNKADIENVKTALKKLISSLEQALDDTQKTKAANQDSQLYIGTKRVQSVLQSNKVKRKELSITAGSTMYRFERDQSLNEVLEKSKTFGKAQTLQGLEVVEHVASGVVVLDLPGETSSEDVKTYFERCGGETLRVNAGYEYSTVIFKDPEVVSRVCLKNDHTIRSQHVDVVPYTDYLGLVQPSFVLDTALDKVECIKFIKEQRTILEKELSECHAEVLWDRDPIHMQCTAQTEDTSKRNLLLSWRDDVKEIIQKFTDKILLKQFRLTEANRQNIKETLISIKATDPSTVFILFADMLLNVVCFEGYKESDLNLITDVIKSKNI